MRRTRFALVFTAAVITACGGNQSALDAAGIQAEQLEGLWWAFFYVTLFVYVTVIAMFVLMITSFRAGRAIDRLANVTPEVAIKVTGHQWWWEIEYQDEQT